jgi:hypothetical protein
MINSKTLKHRTNTWLALMMLALVLVLIFCTQNIYAAENEDPKILRDALNRHPKFEEAFLAGL